MPSDPWDLPKRLRTAGPTARLLFLSALPSLPFIGYVQRNNPGVVFACFSVLAFAAVLLKSWAVFGTLVGVACGFLFQPARTTLEALAQSGPETHLAWTALGLIIGWVIGAVSAPPPGKVSAIVNTAEKYGASRVRGRCSETADFEE
jgi:hypothetical protein